MIRVATDENVPGDSVRGLRRALAELDLVRVQDSGLRGAPDESILEWAAEHSRVVVTADRATMIEFAHARVRQKLPMPGLVVLGRRANVGEAIADLRLIVTRSSPEEWQGLVAYLPL